MDIAALRRTEEVAVLGAQPSRTVRNGRSAPDAGLSRAARIRNACIAMKPGAVDLLARGFPPPSASSRVAFEVLQAHARGFADGYNAVVSSDGPSDLLRRVGDAPPGRTGFWMEGAAMSSTLLD